MNDPEWILAEAPVIRVRKEEERKEHRQVKKVAPRTVDERRQVRPRRY